MKLLYLPLLFIATVCAQTCTSPQQRKEIRDLTSDELYRFTNAVRFLHNTQYSNTNLSIHEQFTKVHNENHEISHSVPRFLPWHRHFIRLYEMELQKIDSSVMLPYWDWSIDAQAPQDSLVLSDWYFGSNGNSNDTYCVQDGEFAYMTLKYDTDHCLQRSYDLGTKISKFAIPEVINPFLNLKKFSDFEDNVEQVHADPHNNIGGGMDFTQMISPNDPLFYLHHSFMDLLWYNWQRRNPKSLQYDGDVYQTKVGLNDPLITWKYDVNSTLNTTKNIYCYTYPSYPTTLKQNVQRRSYNPVPAVTNVIESLIDNNPILNGINSQLTLPQLISKLSNQVGPVTSNVSTVAPKGLRPYKVVKRNPMPVKWAQMNKLNLTRVRQNEALQNYYIDLLNKVPNFVSLAFKTKPERELIKGSRSKHS